MPQDQDDIKGADAMKQAPTPGPLSGDDVKLLVKGDVIECLGDGIAPEGTLMTVTKVDESGIDVLDRGETNSFFFETVAGSFRLAPTAPVEASGSERETVLSILQAAVRSFDSGDTTNLNGVLDDILDALRPQPSWSEEVQTADTTHSRRLFFGDPGSPQPSGETREAVAWRRRPIKELTGSGKEWVLYGPEDAAHYNAATDRYIIQALGVIDPAPVASGGQHSSGEGVFLIEWEDDGEPRKRVQFGTRIEGWLEQRSPKITAMSSTTTTPVAETAGEAVAWIDPADLAQVDEGLATETVLFPREHASATIPLYAAPVPAQDDDKLRIAVEALEPFAAFARVAEAKSRMALGKVLSDDEILASVSWEGGLGVLVMGHFRDALSLAPKPKGWGGLYRRSKALAALKSEGS